MKPALVLLVLCAGCLDGIDPVWQLDHDRIVAVRATPPHVRTGEVALLDGLIAHKGGPTDVETPTAATAQHAPGGLFAAVHSELGVWEVVGPDETELVAARTALGLDPGAPVPLSVLLAFPDSNGHKLIAEKTIWLGDAQDNPELPPVTVAGAPPTTEIVVPEDLDVPMTVDTDPTWTVTWLTSCGTMHDNDEHAAFLHVLPKDPKQGQLAVVVRDPDGGVVWQVWPIHAE